MALNLPQIKIRNLQTQESCLCWMVGKSLAVKRGSTGKDWEITSRQGVIQFTHITTDIDAFLLAKMLNDLYDEYLLMWEEYPQMDVYKVSMWTVPNGIKMYEVIETIRESTKITYADFQQMLLHATGNRYFQNYVIKANGQQRCVS